jgi:hypothetical protein
VVARGGQQSGSAAPERRWRRRRRRRGRRLKTAYSLRSSNKHRQSQRGGIAMGARASQ